MMKLVSTLAVASLLAIVPLHSASAELVNFEGLLAAENSVFNGGPTTNANGFTISNAYFPNDYYSPFLSWTGWSYSNVVDTTQQSYLNQYAAWPGGGSGGSSSYGLAYAYEPTFISFPSPVSLASADFANTTWTALTMLNGDSFGAKKYGGDSGNDPDFLKLTIEGRSAADGLGSITGSINFYLGDFRDANNALDFVRSGWTNVDLSGLGTLQSVRFNMTSSDSFTPSYFAIDNISIAMAVSAVPEPNSLALMVAAVLGVSRLRKRR